MEIETYRIVTASEEISAKEAKMTPKQRAARGRRMLKKLTASYLGMCDHTAPAANYGFLRMMWRYCEGEGVEIPLWMRVEVAIYESAMSPLEREWWAAKGEPLLFAVVAPQPEQAALLGD